MLFLVDFDGTITEVDTVGAMVKTFARGDWQSLNKLWEQKIINTEEVAGRTLATFDADEKDMDDFLMTMKVDPHFPPFAEMVEERGDRLVIVSDGYDYLIQRILAREGLSRIPYYANTLRIDGRKFTMEAGGIRKSCGLCGCCKRDVMEKYRHPDETVVYIGDSYSDFCIAQHADIVFAKKVLLAFCREIKLPCMEYGSFSDILKWYRKA